MDTISAEGFFDKHVKPRWPDWDPEGVEIADWLFWICKTDQDTALSAIREHASETRWKRPTLGKFRTLVRLKSPTKGKVEQAEPTVFVMYEGGGRGTLVAGYYFPVIVRKKEENIMKAAENVRKHYEARIGGTWKVYTETTYHEMNKMRNDIRAAFVDRQG